MPWYEYSTFAGGDPQPLVQVRLWHASRNVRLTALVDSGADFSLIDVRLAERLGLDRRTAFVAQATSADGTAFQTFRWPAASLEIEFEAERLPFHGAFAILPPDPGVTSLLGRRDFFQRFIVQFWDAAELMNIDLSPDFPTAAPHP